MAIKKEKFFEIINEVSKSEGLNENNLLERIGNELEKINSQEHTTHNMYSDLKKSGRLKDKIFSILNSGKTVNCMLLHLAVECNSVPIVKLLLAKGVKVNEPTHELGGVKSQLTALHIAALHGHQEIVQLLLNNDANPLLKDSQGRKINATSMKHFIAYIDVTVADIDGGEKPYLLPYELEPVLEQLLQTKGEKINPYQAFDPVPAQITLNKNIDHWTEVTTNWKSPVTRVFNVKETTELLSSTSYEAEFMREAVQNFEIEGFEPSEKLKEIKFDGIFIQPQA